MTPGNAALVNALATTFDRFERGEVNIEAMQAKVQSTLNLLEGEVELRRLLRSVEGDLEEIRFARLEAEQHGAALSCVRELRSLLRDPPDEGRSRQ
jgi:hypothetical protein